MLRCKLERPFLCLCMPELGGQLSCKRNGGLPGGKDGRKLGNGVTIC
jgi:hypothetical protein